MRLFLCLVTLLTATLGAAPRISQISPATGRIDGETVSWDIDQDGDLDLAYLFAGSPQPIDRPQASTWLENLGGRKFSSPRSLGHGFNSTRRNTIDIALIKPEGSPETFVITSVAVAVNNTTELHLKTVTSSSWQLLRTFEPETTLLFLKSPSLDLSAFFSHTSTKPEILTMWNVTEAGAIINSGEINLPQISGSFNFIPFNLQAADLDQDGDSDLILELNDDTYIYERLASGQFTQTPTMIEIEKAIVGDLNKDGLPELLDGNSLRRVARNDGGMQFTVLDEGPQVNPLAAFVGLHKNEPALFAFLPQGSSTMIKVFTLNENFEFSADDSLTTTISRIDRPHVADFDRDGSSDLTVISRSNLFRSPIRTSGGRSSTNFINIAPTRPNFDQVTIAWEFTGSPTDFSPAAAEAPVMCNRPALGDFNNDGFTDLIVGPDSQGNAWIMLNDGHGGFPESRILTELVPPEINPETFHLQDFVTVDLNEDGFLDLSFTMLEPKTSLFPIQTAAACAVALGNGEGGFHQVVFPPGSFETVSIGFCGISKFIDWDGDGDLDAILQGAWRENVDGSLREGAYPLAQNAPVPDALGNPVTVLAQHISDIDGDGYPDLFLPAITSTPVSWQGGPIIGGGLFDYTAGVIFNSGNGGLAEISERPARLLVTDALGNPVTLPFLSLDLDLDGQRELLVAEASVDALGNPVFLRIEQWTLDAQNPRDLSLARAVAFPAFSIPFTDELVDFNGDGTLEYAAEDQFITPTPRGPLLSPKYLFRGDHLTAVSSSAVAVADFDNDGDIDSLYADGFSGLYLVRNTLVDEDSPITAALVAEGLTPSQATPQVDADGDGRSNALEFLQGTDPLVIDQPPVDFLNATLSPDGQRLTFNRPTNAEELALRYELEVSQDLLNWSRISTSEATIESTNENSQKVSVEIPRSRTSNYFRISASHDPRRP